MNIEKMQHSITPKPQEKDSESFTSPSISSITHPEQLSSDVCIDLATNIKRVAHPVLLIGIGASGKTSLLASLLNYPAITKQPLVTTRYGSPLLPSSYPNVDIRTKDARLFYNKALEKIAANQPQAGSSGDPLYVSVHASYKVPNHPQPWERNFAFLEMMGEMIEMAPSPGENGDSFRSLPDQVSALLSHYDGPLSLIFVGPAANARSPIGGLDNAHPALVNAIQNYQRLRTNQSKDNLLYVLTYWDQWTQNQPNLFAHPTGEDLAQALSQQPVRQSWNAFRALHNCVRTLSILPYAPGFFKDDAQGNKMFLGAAGPNAEVYASFNEAIWNWLYGNATEDSVAQKRLSLKPSIATQPPSFMERALSYLLLDMGKGLFRLSK